MPTRDLPNTIERIRRKIGLPRSTTKDLLGVPDDAIFRFADQRINPEVLARARALEDGFERWRAAVHYAVDREAQTSPARVDPDGTRYLTTRQAAHCLGTGDYHLSTLHLRGRIDSVSTGRGQGKINLFTVQALTDLIDNTGPRGHSDTGAAARPYQAPLSHAFVEWWERITATSEPPSPTEDREPVPA